MISLSFPAMSEPAALLTVISTLALAATSYGRNRSAFRRIPAATAISIALPILIAVLDEILGLDGKVACDIAIAIPPLLIFRLKRNQSLILLLLSIISIAVSIYARISGQEFMATNAFCTISLLCILILFISEMRRKLISAADITASLSISEVFSDAIYMILTCGILCFCLTTSVIEPLRPFFNVSLTTVSCALFALTLIRHDSGHPFVLLNNFEKEIMAACYRHTKERIGQGDQKDIMNSVIFKRILKLFEDKMPFLDDEFTLTKLAEQLFTNRIYVSRAISECSGMNFCQFVNTYRIRYSIECARLNPRLKISEMATMCGFKTQSSYNQAFRKYTGENPSDWVRRNFRKNNSEAVLQN